ncbi:MAG: phytanoyl-CoA dioxygenase family protein [Phycisphaeraceae bacterium]
MKTELTADQIEQYQRDGVLYYPQFLDADEVQELKAAALDAIATMGKRKVAADGAALTEGHDSYYDKVFTQRLNLWRISDTVKRYMFAPPLGRMLCQLEGQPAFRVWHDQALIKEPFANPTSWHLDNPFWSFYSRHAISIWIALEEATPYNGCMCFIPGSHRLARFDNVDIGANMTDLFATYPEMAQCDPVPYPMKPGDCSFHNGLVAHGAGANMTRSRRIAMTCAYMPDGSTFNGQQNVLPDDYFQSLAVGDVLNHDIYNPLVPDAPEGR